MKKTSLIAGAGASVLILALIIGVGDKLFPAPGLCRQCECAVYELNDAGMQFVRSQVLSFGGSDLAPDATVESLTERACLSQARQVCRVPAGETVASQSLEIRQCVKNEQTTCERGGLSRTLACRACTPARACAQTEPVANITRAASEFNCACAPARYDAGFCREPIPYADAGPFYRPSPQGVTLTPERALGGGCIRGLPCVELGELRAELGEGYPIPEACRPWPGPDAGAEDAGVVEVNP